MNNNMLTNAVEEQQVIFCKSQEEFARTLREVAATGEENGFMDELGEE